LPFFIVLSWLKKKNKVQMGNLILLGTNYEAERCLQIQRFIFNNYSFFDLICNNLMLIFDYKTFFYNIKLI
jgi:hypothetical protein